MYFNNIKHVLVSRIYYGYIFFLQKTFVKLKLLIMKKISVKLIKNFFFIIFLGWYDSEGSTAVTNSLTVAGGQTGNYGANEKSFGECKKENFGMNSDKPEYYSNTAWITLIMKDKVLIIDYLETGLRENIFIRGVQTKNFPTYSFTQPTQLN